MDNQTDCLGYLTYTSWIWGQAHPQAFAPEDIGADRRGRPSLMLLLQCIAPLQSLCHAPGLRGCRAGMLQGPSAA